MENIYSNLFFVLHIAKTVCYRSKRCGHYSKEKENEGEKKMNKNGVSKIWKTESDEGMRWMANKEEDAQN